MAPIDLNGHVASLHHWWAVTYMSGCWLIVCYRSRLLNVSGLQIDSDPHSILLHVKLTLLSAIPMASAVAQTIINVKSHLHMARVVPDIIALIFSNLISEITQIILLHVRVLIFLSSIRTLLGTQEDEEVGKLPCLLPKFRSDLHLLAKKS